MVEATWPWTCLGVEGAGFADRWKVREGEKRRTCYSNIFGVRATERLKCSFTGMEKAAGRAGLG